MSQLESTRFNVKRVIGRGGVSIVYLAHDWQLRRDVALKVSPRDAAGPETEAQTVDRLEKIGRLKSESRYGASLAHPNVVRLLDAGEWDHMGRSYEAIVQEFVQGSDLTEVIRGLRESAEFRLRWPRFRLLSHFARACEGVAHAHDRNVIHCDLKPENIRFLNDYTRARVLDFGLARDYVAGDRIMAEGAAEGRIIGTIPYMSPEQHQGSVLDARTDVWSLGVVLYEMLTLSRPFEGDDQTAVIRAIAKEEAVPPNKRIQQMPTDRAPEQVPEALVAIVRRCLAKDRLARYASAGALLEELLSFLSNPKGLLDLFFPPALRRRYEAGDAVVQEGRPPKYLYILEKGHGSVIFDQGDRRETCVEGFFGEATSTRAAAVRAGENGCELIELGEENLTAFSAKGPTLRRKCFEGCSGGSERTRGARRRPDFMFP
jgi:serine/threonine-protein kinase